MEVMSGFGDSNQETTSGGEIFEPNWHQTHTHTQRGFDHRLAVMIKTSATRNLFDRKKHIARISSKQGDKKCEWRAYPLPPQLSRSIPQEAYTSIKLKS